MVGASQLHLIDRAYKLRNGLSKQLMSREEIVQEESKTLALYSILAYENLMRIYVR